VEASHRSIHPNIPGVPWWTALLIAITATAVGYGIDAGHKELTHVFAGCYITGCVAAVLAVRQEGLFTAIIQPPLILFCAVPGAYYLFHDGKIGHLKDLLINCGYPLIERFPLMLGTAGAVLLIGLVRWYFGMSQRTASATDDAAGADSSTAHSPFGGLAAKLHSILRPESPEEAAAATRRGRTLATAAKSRRATRAGRSTAGATRTHSRHTRPPLDDAQDPGERPRRSGRRGPAPARDYDQPPRRSRRRPRPDTDPDPRDQPPRGGRREPRPRRSPYERPAARGGRFDDYDMYDRPGAAGRYSPYEPDDSYDPAYEPKRRRTTSGANPSHHPISQVRYRGAAAGEPTRADPRGQYRPRSRANGNGRSPAESWEYDR